MKQVYVSLAVAVAGMALMIAGCTQAAPAPAPTKAPAAPTKAAEATVASAAPTKAAEPTKPAAAPPTAAPAPAKKVDYPAKGKTITVIVPNPPGGITDTAARLLAPGLQKELGISVDVVNKSGAGGQAGMTDIATAKPDGYTIGYTLLPPVIVFSMDPRREAVFSRKSYQLLALQAKTPITPTVRADSPYKSMKDLIDAAKAKPRTIKASTTGIGNTGHLGILGTQKATGAEFAIVRFEGDAPATTALLGGHIDVSFSTGAAQYGQVRAGAMRALAVMDKEPSEFFPGVPTMESLGYKIYYATSVGISAPAGLPKEILDILSGPIKGVIDSQEHKDKMKAAGNTVMYLGPEEYSKYWEEVESQVKPIMPDVLAAR